MSKAMPKFRRLVLLLYICYRRYRLLLMVYCYKVLNFVHTNNSHHYFLCFMYLLIYNTVTLFFAHNIVSWMYSECTVCIFSCLPLSLHDSSCFNPTLPALVLQGKYLYLCPRRTFLLHWQIFFRQIDIVFQHPGQIQFLILWYHMWLSVVHRFDICQGPCRTKVYMKRSFSLTRLFNGCKVPLWHTVYSQI
jgi:hypothetical protein